MDTYLAIVEGTSTPDDFRLTVRPLPNMKLIIDIGTLPRFPFFFKNKTYTGKIGELVWILANKEFTMGYVVGKANKFSWNDEYLSQSITTDIFEKIRNVYVDLKGIILPFSDLEITYWDDNCLHAVDARDGRLIIGYSSGSINIISKDEILLMEKRIEEIFENYQLLCEELEVKSHVITSFRKYIRDLTDVKAIQKDFINPSRELRGRKLEIRLTDISAEKLDEYFTKHIGAEIKR